MTGPQNAPAALVIVASSALGHQLRRVRDSGWAGPVVVVGSHAEAAELAETPRPTSRQLMLDPDRRLAVSDGGRTPLTPLEYDVLHTLLLRPGRVCHFADLTEQVWGTRFLGDTAQVHSVVKRVRRKLGSIGSPLQVQAVRGVGFRAVLDSGSGSVSHDRVTGE